MKLSIRKISGRHISGLKEIKHSVPQGSVLGPILLLVYIKDLSINIQGQTQFCLPMVQIF